MSEQPTLFRVSASSLSAFAECPKRYDYTYRQRLVPLRTSPDRRLLGTLVHAAIEEHFTAKVQERPADPFLAVRWEAEQFVSDNPTVDRDAVEYASGEAVPIAAHAFSKIGYLDPYRDESGALIERAFELEHEGLLVRGKIDLVARDPETGYLWLIDHKVRGTFYTEEAEEASPQFALYQWALSKMFGVMVAGRLTVQIKPHAPMPPDLTTRGELCRDVRKLHCDWDLYRRMIEACKFDVADYAGMEHKLSPLVKVTRTHVHSAEYEGIVRELFAIARLAESGVDYRNLRSFSCPRCDYRTLCMVELRDGDSEWIRSAEYQSKDAHNRPVITLVDDGETDETEDEIFT